MAIVSIKKNMIPLSMHSLGNKNIVGRSEECDIIVLEEYISRKHFQITRREDDFFLENLSSKSIKLSGKMLKKSKETKLVHGDIIELGSYEFVFQVKLDQALAETFDFRYLNSKKVENSSYFLYLNI